MSPQPPQAPSPCPGLDALASSPELLASLDGSQIPTVLAQLGAVQALLAAELLKRHGAPVRTEEKLLTVPDAASHLRVSKDWIYRRTRSLPFIVRLGREVRVSSAELEKFVSRQKR
ncbi:MAG: helix-turn-helix domain-containing protein [Fimbriimonadaceae bacterium]|nr:helix-turn-helix domain-containing protein [Fimbriimonadaceae bacterium]